MSLLSEYLDEMTDLANFAADRGTEEHGLARDTSRVRETHADGVEVPFEALVE